IFFRVEKRGLFGDWNDLLGQFNLALSLFKELLGPSHIWTLRVLYMKGLFCASRSRFKEAASIFELLASKFSETLGPKHMEARRCHCLLGAVLESQRMDSKV